MSKPPQTSGGMPRRVSLGTLFSRRRSGGAVKPVVAEPLTEEQAMEELARGQDEAQARRQAAEAREAAKQAKHAERAARKMAAREERARRKEAAAAQGKRTTFTLTTASCVGVAGLACALVLAAYSLGRNSGEQRGPLTPAAALNNKPVQKTALPVDVGPAETTKPPVHPDLSELLKKPEPKTDRMVKANKPARVTGDETAAAAALPEQLNYLQIESFLITRDRNGEQLAADLSHVRKFLLDRGMRTFARKRSNGYVLFCEQGVQPGKDHASQRDALRKKIQQLGQEYRAGGGLYQFKGCLFVNYEATRAGDPV